MTGSTRTTLVVGASRGLGRGVADALAAAGDSVISVARSAPADVIADAADPATPAALLSRYQPDAVVLVAGATPHLAPLHEQSWETFSVNWHTDVKMAFHWLGQVLRDPLRQGRRVIVFGSGAALHGSPLSGGYAGAKATERFVVRYAAEEADRAGLGISITELLPRLTPRTELGLPAVRAYAARAGMTEPEYLQQFGAPLTPEIAGRAVVDLLGADPAELAATYLLTGAGLQPMV